MRSSTETQRQAANEQDQSGNSQIEKIKLPEFPQEAVFYSPLDHQSHQQGLLLWLGTGEPEGEQAILDVWQELCDRDGFILLVARPREGETWSGEDGDYLSELIRVALRRLNVDRQRLAVGGRDKAGQLAFTLALQSRSGFAGVISVDAPLPRTLRVPASSPARRLAVSTPGVKELQFCPSDSTRSG